MSNLKTKELSKIGYTDDIARSLAINTLAKHYKHSSKAECLALLTNLKNNPEDYVNDEHLGRLAAAFITTEKEDGYQSFDLVEQTGPLKLYGAKHIEASAKRQMELAMSLPIVLQGALMPDAHTGYGLPIGGVLATKGAVVPYAVGVDIGCRMALSLIDEGERYLETHTWHLKKALGDHTHFGMEGGLDNPQEHAILDHPDFKTTTLLRKLQAKAVRQLGTSGSGNHFVEFGLVELKEDNMFGLPARKYVALLSHSGSRGLGANIAQHYTAIAMDTCKLPRTAQQLAWLDINSEAGSEYWLSMNLAGAYAQACHDRIHANLLRALGLQSILKVENHHNFAWKDTLADGREVFLHRKGATPAHKGEAGIIPGSMTTPAYLVCGKGEPGALYSASHGAGRAMSRKRARESMTVSGLKKILATAGVSLQGGSVEEFPGAYKDIDKIIAAQQDLVDIQGKFWPKIVRMHKE